MKNFFLFLLLSEVFTFDIAGSSEVTTDHDCIKSARKDAEKFRTVINEKLRKGSDVLKRKRRMLDLDVMDVGGNETDPPICLGCVAVFCEPLTAKEFEIYDFQCRFYPPRIFPTHSYMKLTETNRNFHTGVNLIQYYIATGKKTPEIIQMLYALCVGTKYKPPKYCEELTNLIGPEVVEILSNTTNTPREVCSFVFNAACGNGDVPHHRWSIELPNIPKPPMKPRVPPKLNTPKFKVLHISDTHYDPLYQEGTRDICELPMCCRTSNGIAGANESFAGKWGGWKCDIPEKTLDNLLEHLNQTHSPFDYIIWTGDIPPHATWSQTVDESITLLNSTVAKLLHYFPDTPIFPALGNHEASPPHNFAPPVLGNQETISWLYEALAKEWSHFLPDSTQDTIRYGGFYSTTVRTGLKIVSLNTNFCYYNNWWLILNSTDPANMLNWFIQELQNAEEKNEKVHVIAHIPPGYIDCLKIWGQNYFKIISRYEATVTAQFFGHTHTDEIELYYNTEDSTKPAGVAYVGPSASTFTFLNPGYRIYSIDGHHSESQYFVENFETWIMNLTEANLSNDPVWYMLFTAKEDYKLDSLLPEEWNKFYERLKTDDELLELYDRHYWKDSCKRPKCDAKCRRTRLCDIRSCVHYGEPNFVSNRN